MLMKRNLSKILTYFTGALLSFSFAVLPAISESEAGWGGWSSEAQWGGTNSEAKWGGWNSEAKWGGWNSEAQHGGTNSEATWGDWNSESGFPTGARGYRGRRRWYRNAQVPQFANYQASQNATMRRIASDQSVERAHEKDLANKPDSYFVQTYGNTPSPTRMSERTYSSSDSYQASYGSALPPAHKPGGIIATYRRNNSGN
jgi:hypothetical protein